MGAITIHATPDTDPLLLETDTDAMVRLSVCNTEAGTTSFEVYKSQGTNKFRLIPPTNLNTSDRIAFIYENLILQRGFGINVKILSGKADIDISFQDTLQ